MNMYIYLFLFKSMVNYLLSKRKTEQKKFTQQAVTTLYYFIFSIIGLGLWGVLYLRISWK